MCGEECAGFLADPSYTEAVAPAQTDWTSSPFALTREDMCVEGDQCPPPRSSPTRVHAWPEEFVDAPVRSAVRGLRPPAAQRPVFLFAARNSPDLPLARAVLSCSEAEAARRPDGLARGIQ